MRIKQNVRTTTSHIKTTPKANKVDFVAVVLVRHVPKGRGFVCEFHEEFFGSKEARRELLAEYPAQEEAEALLRAEMPSPVSDDEAVRYEGTGLPEEYEEDVTGTVSVPVNIEEEISASPFMPSFTDLLPFLLHPM